MADNIKKYLTASVVKLLRPLVRILLRYGISYGEFAEMARWVFVNVAEKDFGIAGRKQTISRISVITGLNRKDVTRLTKIDINEDKTASTVINRAGRVIGGWVKDQSFHDSNGVPAVLPLEGEKNSFAELVKLYSGDMPVRAVLDELIRIEAVKKNEDNTVSLLTRAYIPKNIDVEKISILGVDAADLMSTIDHNLDEKKQPFFQRKVVYDNIPSEAVEGFRETSTAEGQHLLEKLNVLLSGQDRDCNPAIEGSGRRRLGVGIYYFEEDISETENKKKEKKKTGRSSKK
ncbi:MAG: hypothetical protein AMJ61_12615 [Desulfobacterales bacterium SG8_35_2]|nr:MAG: hypothetical protein AMJ61_12615 [Desulfobacterales bacterium SG8_35_2]